MEKIKIFVCDDDPGILEVVKIILEQNNYKVLTASSGKGIQKKLAESQPNLLLLDLWMPGIEGTEITRILKKDDSTKNIPIIIISALSDTNNITRQIGADGFLPKPFAISDLLAIVKKNIHIN